MTAPKKSESYSETETAKRREAITRAMIATPPTPHSSKPKEKLSRGKKATRNAKKLS